MASPRRVATMSSSCPAVIALVRGWLPAHHVAVDDGQDPATAALHRRGRPLLHFHRGAVGGGAILDGHAGRDEHPGRARPGWSRAPDGRRRRPRRRVPRGHGCSATRSHRMPSRDGRRGRGRTAGPRCAGRDAWRAPGAPWPGSRRRRRWRRGGRGPAPMRSVRSMSVLRASVATSAMPRSRAGPANLGSGAESAATTLMPRSRSAIADPVAQRTEADHDDVVLRIPHVGPQDVRDPRLHQHVHDQAVEGGQEDGAHDGEADGEELQVRRGQARLDRRCRGCLAKASVDRVDDADVLSRAAGRTPRRPGRAPR